MKKVVSIVLNNFKNDSRVLKENISLQKNGYTVKVVALWEEGLKEYETIQNIPVHRIKLKSKKWSKNRLIQILKYMECIYLISKNYKNTDILHCNDLNTLPIAYIVKKFYNKNIKVVYDAHEYETETNGLRGFQKRLVKFLERRLIVYADKVICVSDMIANEYEKLYNIEKPALVLNTPLYKQINKKDIFREKFGIKKDKTIFLYQGSISRGRGVEIVLECFKTMQKTEAVIVFMGYGELEEYVKEVASQENNIYFHSAVEPDVLLDYTSSADFGISTIEDSCLSYRYCLPNKMFEYIMADVPVIVSNLPEMSKVVQENGVGVILQENTPCGLQTAIEEALVLDKDELYKNIQKAKEIYNWQEQEKVLLEVYKGI